MSIYPTIVNMIEQPISNQYKVKKKESSKLDHLEKAILTHHAITNHPVYEMQAHEILSKFEDKLTAYEAIQTELFPHGSAPFHGPKAGQEKFTFIDLFAGIGGFRMALQKLGGRCLFSSEYDKFAQQTYYANYGEVPFGDITQDQVKAFIPEKFEGILMQEIFIREDFGVAIFI